MFPGGAAVCYTDAMTFFRTAQCVMIALCALCLPSVAGNWRLMEECKLIANDFNDGDSFHVRWHGREYIFRLYFVDAPESDASLEDRVIEQAAYWEVDPEQIPELAKAATAFTKERLKNGFTVYTKYEDARGRSDIKRYYAMVKVDGEYLSESLIRSGYARLYGNRTPILPDGTPEGKYSGRLRTAERQAKRDGVGGWSKEGAMQTFLNVNSVSGTIILDRNTVLYSLDTPPRTLGSLAKGSALDILGARSPSMMHVRLVKDGTPIEGQCRRSDIATALRQLKQVRGER